MHHLVRDEVVERLLHLRRLHVAEALVGLEGQLEGGALEVLHQHLHVVGVDAGLLHRRAQQLLGGGGDVLIHRRAGGDQQREAGALPSPRAAEALPQRRHAARPARAHHRVERAHVDAQLQRAGGHHAAHVAAAQPRLDVAPLLRQVAGAVGLHQLGREPRLHQGVAQVLEHHLDVVPRLAEEQRGHAGLHQVGRQPRARLHVGLADAQLRVHHRRVVEQHPALSARRAALVDQLHLAAQHARGVLLRVADGGRGHQVLRSGPVEARHPVEPAQHVGQVRAEHAAVGVQLVDDHVLEAREEARPVRVVREHAGVQHVGVGQDDAAALAGRPSRVGRGVAVEGDRAVVELRFLHQPAQRLFLVAGERLGGEEEERARLAIRRQRLQHRQHVAEALARGGGGGHHQVLARQGLLEGEGLVRVEALDAPGLQRLAQPRLQRLGHRHRLRARALQRLVEGDVAPHPAIAAPLLQQPVHPVRRGPRSPALACECEVHLLSRSVDCTGGQVAAQVFRYTAPGVEQEIARSQHQVKVDPWRRSGGRSGMHGA